MFVKQKLAAQKVLQCGLGVTDNARKGIRKYAKDEYAFFSAQDAFAVHIEKRPVNKQGNMSFSFFFDNAKNERLSKTLDNRIAVMECIYQHDGFLATGFHVRGRKEVVRTNRRLPVRLKFQLGRGSGATMPVELYTSLRELPIAQERSVYVEKRIASWEGYLGIQERNADVADVTVAYSTISFNKDFSKLRLICSGLQNKDWHAIKGFSAKINGHQSDIGNVIATNRAKSSIEIELHPKYREMARRNEWRPKLHKEVVFSNFAELSQVRRLRQGFKDLQDGLAANPNLEKILFEERPVVRISKQKNDLVFHNELNKFQQEAVTGAMTANDLYVIQGPPGTGKTTVISEICHQNVKAGLRTLVASQANLAVDNALGRLLSHQDIRILRYGRTESIEEEGKKFIEENVALNWKNQTLEAVHQQLQSHAIREKQLVEELAQCEKELEQLQNELLVWEEKVKVSNEAKVAYSARSNDMEKLNKIYAQLTTEHEEISANQEIVNKSVEALSIEIDRIEKLVASESIRPETNKEMATLKQQIASLHQAIGYLDAVEKAAESEATLAKYRHELEAKQSRKNQLGVFVKEIVPITKRDVLVTTMDEFDVVLPVSLQQKMTDLHSLIEQIASDTSSDVFNEWKELHDRLVAAIEMIEHLLKTHAFSTNLVKRNANQKYNTVKEIHGLIDRVGRFLIEPSTKKILEMRHYSAEKYDYLEKIAVALELLRERRRYARAQGAQFAKQHQMKLDVKQLFDALKSGIKAYFGQSIEEMEREGKALQENVEAHQLELSRLQQICVELREQLEYIDEHASIERLQEEVQSKEKVHADYEEKKAALQQYIKELADKKTTYEMAHQKLEELSAKFLESAEEMESVNKKILEQEKKLAILEELLKENPEEQYEQTLSSFYALTKQIDHLQIEKEHLPITRTLQEEWLSRLTEANEYDLDEIRKLYVKHANVIGTTCVASARRDFMEEYPRFDVVIIDEVSKATPPELLLPMLKGKKIILVGDHHQLPPLIGQETLEEFLEEIDGKEDKKEFEKLLNESLFERLFRTLPKQNKTMLGIQYRMHENIMQTITPFYEDGDYHLQCGLADSDAMRDHLLDSTYIQRGDHLLWFDMPNEPAYFEEKVKGGTSRFNQAELSMTKKLLLDLEMATEKAKRDGRMRSEDRKSVGVISFYGEQVKRIDRLIQQELMPQHLHCRTGSVDKFQGMEMDVIILSFVRNHEERGGDIGFAKDYRRLNVALSRARELLIIVGSADMFTIRTKHSGSKEMYGRLLENIKMQNRFRDHEGNVKS